MKPYANLVSAVLSMVTSWISVMFKTTTLYRASKPEARGSCLAFNIPLGMRAPRASKLGKIAPAYVTVVVKGST